jgi:predicted RNA-binding protein YlqC (UPF0109 family)
MRDFLGETQPLLLLIVHSLVDVPEAATVQLSREVMPAIFVVRVDASDVGKLIGSQGRMARAIRAIFGASAQALKHPSVAIDIGPNA